MISSYPELRRSEAETSSSPWADPRDGIAEVDEPQGTAERMVHVERAALALAEIVEDLVRDMEMIVLNLRVASKRTHELAQAKRAQVLARALRTAVRDARTRY